MRFFPAAILLCLAGLARADDVPSFRHEIIPLLTRYGCNQGACHGKGAGQGGFRLSLRGYAPEWDYQWLTREFQSRRLSSSSPDDSLILRKPAGETPHGGGRLFLKESRAYSTLKQWIAAGAPGLRENEPTVERLEVRAEKRQMAPGETQPITVTAKFSDGQSKDVTWLTQFFSNDETVLEVSPAGLVKCQRPGETAIRVHFQTLVDVALFTAPFPREVDPQQFTETKNVIDPPVFQKLATLKIPPSPVCDDATFIRRAFLDSIGTLPTADEVRQFLADGAADKRARLVDQLLDRPEFIDYWTLNVCDLFQNRRERDHDVRGSKGVREFHAWLRQQLSARKPWNEICRAVLLAQGDGGKHPEIGYYLVNVGEQRRAEQSDVVASVAQAFLGTRIGCAKCHNHPLERYTQDDYYHFAAFFSRIAMHRQEPAKGPTSLVIASEHADNMLREIEQNEKRRADLNAGIPVQDAAKTQQDLKQIDERIAALRKEIDKELQRPVTVSQPRTNQQLGPQPLDRKVIPQEPGSDPRSALVGWMTSPENENFSGNLVNRLWKHFLGVGLVEPVDDLRASNPPSNPELWQTLNREFVTSGYDIRHVMRLILNSRTYQLCSDTRPENQDDARYYSHYFARRLPAEVLLDAITNVTAVPENFPGYPLGMRAIQLPEPGISSYFLSLFGRSDRVTACACERNGEVTLPQLLHLQTGEIMQTKLYAPDGRVAEVLKQHTDDNAAVETLFLTVLGRLPNPEERTRVSTLLTGAENRSAAFQDLLWALLNAKEFAFNH